MEESRAGLGHPLCPKGSQRKTPLPTVAGSCERRLLARTPRHQGRLCPHAQPLTGALAELLFQDVPTSLGDQQGLFESDLHGPTESP